jgi:hypothetical protein
MQQDKETDWNANDVQHNAHCTPGTPGCSKIKKRRRSNVVVKL